MVSLFSGWYDGAHGKFYPSLAQVLGHTFMGKTLKEVNEASIAVEGLKQFWVQRSEPPVQYEMDGELYVIEEEWPYWENEFGELKVGFHPDIVGKLFVTFVCCCNSSCRLPCDIKFVLVGETPRSSSSMKSSISMINIKRSKSILWKVSILFGKFQSFFQSFLEVQAFLGII